MISNKELFSQLRNGDEWCSCNMTKEVYHGIDFELREQMTLDVRQTNNDFRGDPIHIELMAKLSKAKKYIRDYEFKKNHG